MRLSSISYIPFAAANILLRIAVSLMAIVSPFFLLLFSLPPHSSSCSSPSLIFLPLLPPSRPLLYAFLPLSSPSRLFILSSSLSSFSSSAFFSFFLYILFLYNLFLLPLHSFPFLLPLGSIQACMHILIFEIICHSYDLLIHYSPYL